MEEKVLYEQLKEGDLKAFNQLFKMHYVPLVKMLYRKCFDQPLSEDIVQNIFINLWGNRNSLNINTSVGAYLATSVRNKYIDHFRKQKRIEAKEKEYLNTSLKLNISSPEEELLSEENLAKIYSKIEELPFKSKAVFQLSRFENMSNMEISEELNVSIKTVEYHITKALRLLRESIFFILFLNIC